MMITTEDLPNLNIDLKFKKTKYPQCKDPNLPRLFFVSLFIGSRGSGKTYSAAKLLKMYEHFGIYAKGHEVYQRIFLISPTTQANPCFSALKNLSHDDIHEEYSDSLLLSIVENIREEKQNTEDYLKKIDVWKRFCKCKDVDHMSHEDIFLLHHMGFEEPLKPKYDKTVVNFIVLDDLVGSSAFKSTGKSDLTNVLLKCRHLSISFIIMSQNLKGIPKSIRTNTSVFIIFKYGSKKIITEDLYEEVSNLTTIKNFEALYDFATQDEHDSLIIDFTQPRIFRFKKNWNQIIKISE